MAIVFIADIGFAHAALFGDNETKAKVDVMAGDVTHLQERVNQLTLQVQELNQRLESQSNAQVSSATQMQDLREQLANLRGSLEVIQQKILEIDRRRQDFYFDLDTRMRKLEMGTSTPAAALPLPPAQSAASDTDIYEMALTAFKAGDFKKSAAGFEDVITKFPNSPLLPNAYYWEGYSYLKLSDLVKAQQYFSSVVSRWPTHGKAPDALLGKYNSQKAQGNAKGAQETLRVLLQTYPQSNAATLAKQGNTLPF